MRRRLAVAAVAGCVSWPEGVAARAFRYLFGNPKESENP